MNFFKRFVRQWRALDPAWRFAFGAYLAARVALSAWAFVIALLFPIVVRNLDLFGAPTLAVFDLESGERYAYSRVVNGATLTFRSSDPGFVIDEQTNSVWSLRDGRAVSGTFAGQACGTAAYSIEEIYPYHGVAPEKNLWLSVWQRFDANWYLAIAARGYGTIIGDTHFPPLYPALIRVAGAIIGDDFVAALAISNLAFLVALVLLYRIAREQWDAATAERAVALLLIFPTAFFFFGAYTESLFLVLALLALRAMQNQQWAWAGLWIFCAILTRLQGVALVVPLAYALWSVRPFDQKFSRGVALALPALAMGLYLGLRAVTGDSSVVPLAETDLHARMALPWENYFYALQTLASGKFIVADALNFLVTTLCGVALVIGWRRLPPLWNLYAWASLLVLTMRVVETQPLNSMARYALTLFPVFALGGVWSKNPWVQRALVYPGFALALYLCAQYVLWGWVG
jgi:hypothetical protein